MKYIKLFNRPENGHMFNIDNIPFVTAVSSTNQTPVYCKKPQKYLKNINNELYVIPIEVKYTATAKVNPNITDQGYEEFGANLIGNDYDPITNEGVFKFDGPVTKIENSVFEKTCESLTSIIIPNSVTSIGVNAFYGCINLTSVEIPNGVIRIREYAFGSCKSLTSIKIPNSITNIEEKAFHGCSSLTSVTVDANNITYDSRGNCNAIIETVTNTLIVGCKNTVIPNTITRIEADAFLNCTGLTSIEIPNSVTSIGNSAFDSCISLTSINIPNSITSIGDHAFIGCIGLTSLTIGHNVTIIEYMTFSGCNSLIYVEIPNNITVIEDYAFSFCKSLTSVIINSGSIGGGVFQNCSGLISVTIGDNTTSIGNRVFVSCTSLTSVTIGESVINIEQEAFRDCTSLTNITCKSLTPPTTKSYVFYNVPTASATLYVPQGCTEAYRNWSGYTWGSIREIQEQVNS